MEGSTRSAPRAAYGLPLATLRGIAQVDFQANPWTGLCFLVALFAGGWQFGVFGMLGTVVSMAAAWIFGIARERISTGLAGYNGTLIGVALVLYFDAHWITVLLTVVGAAVGAVVMAAMTAWLSPRGMPALTAPFCVVTTILAIGAPTFARVWRIHAPAQTPSALDSTRTLTFTDLWQGLLNGIGQVFFQDRWYVGLIFLIGLLIASRAVAAAAVVSSAAGLVVALILGAYPADVAAGLYGYNAVLTGIALAVAFVTPTGVGLLYAAVGTVAATVVTAFVGNLFAPVGGHTLTWPFVLVTWTFLAALPVLSGIVRSPAKEHS